MTVNKPVPRKPKRQSNRLFNGCMTFLGAIIMIPFILSLVSNIRDNVSRTFDPQTAEHDRMRSVVSDFIDKTRNNDLQDACAVFESKVPRPSCQAALKLVRNKYKNVFLEFSSIGGSNVEFSTDLARLSGILSYPGPPSGYFDALFVREEGNWRIRAIMVCLEDLFNEIGGSQCILLDPLNNFKWE